MKKERLGKVGKPKESLWKRFSMFFPFQICSFKGLKNSCYAQRITFNGF